MLWGGSYAYAADILDEPFGDDLILECDLAWADVCEADWGSVPGTGAGKLGMKHTGGNWGVQVTGGVTPNGARATLIPVDSSVESVRLLVKAHGTYGEGDLVARLDWRNSAGTVIRTQSHEATLEMGDVGVWTVHVRRWPAAHTVDVSFRLQGPAIAWIDSVELESTEMNYNANDEIDCKAQANMQKLLEEDLCGMMGGVAWSGGCTGVYHSGRGECDIECNGTCS